MSIPWIEKTKASVFFLNNIRASQILLHVWLRNGLLREIKSIGINPPEMAQFVILIITKTQIKTRMMMMFIIQFTNPCYQPDLCSSKPFPWPTNSIPDLWWRLPSSRSENVNDEFGGWLKAEIFHSPHVFNCLRLSWWERTLGGEPEVEGEYIKKKPGATNARRHLSNASVSSPLDSSKRSFFFLILWLLFVSLKLERAHFNNELSWTPDDVLHSSLSDLNLVRVTLILGRSTFQILWTA